MAQTWGYVDHSGTVVSGMHTILRGQILPTNSGNFKMGFFYSFNDLVERRTAFACPLDGGVGRLIRDRVWLRKWAVVIQSAADRLS